MAVSKPKAPVETGEKVSDGERAQSLLDVPTTRIRQDKASGIIATELRRLILSECKVGDHLPPERFLIEKFGVSRPTFREALRVLESEGLVKIRRGVLGGAEVRRPSIDDIARIFGMYLQLESTTIGDLFLTRSVIEPAAARFAAKNPDAGVILDEVVAREAELLHDADDEAMSEVFAEFHDAVLKASASQTVFALGKLLDAVIIPDNFAAISAISAEGISSRRKAFGESHRSHQRLSAVIKSGDADRAEKGMRRHLEIIERQYSSYTDAVVSLFRKDEHQSPGPRRRASNSGAARTRRR
jgi:DNA-binding FadR family transcriptional regulator